ncbi:hypothetical protein PAECIP111891_02147 [Paenibacillus allorhizoplanae]|uniref:Helix-turn-helix transcriptional regulator n=1 Tax=Paenibacillus allorhizoplanae TaxID=2905648 RepID=A0ABM9C556_9BACL|nr:hypothetical protein [Paenibacillus allorhizoplanae]CAH1202926.1 hypothetical protein PAECIP111891_02147 [Paenibacillus allorhizoplanae]
MKVILKPGVLENLQKELNMNDQEFADHIGVSRSHLWRAKMPISDKRFSLGQDFIARVLNTFSGFTFEEIFFLNQLSQDCDSSDSNKAI